MGVGLEKDKVTAIIFRLSFFGPLCRRVSVKMTYRQFQKKTTYRVSFLKRTVCFSHNDTLSAFSIEDILSQWPRTEFVTMTMYRVCQNCRVSVRMIRRQTVTVDESALSTVTQTTAWSYNDYCSKSFSISGTGNWLLQQIILNHCQSSALSTVTQRLAHQIIVNPRRCQLSHKQQHDNTKITAANLCHC